MTEHDPMLRFLPIALLLLLGATAASPLLGQQLYTAPLPDNAALRAATYTRHHTKAKRGGHDLDTLDLPFIDDFSYPGVYPSAHLWCDRATYVNHTLAIRPPSIGVATFDGLNAAGVPYANAGQGSADTLTSMPLKMGGLSANGNVRLSFYYQPRGYGDKPGFNDSLMVEVKLPDDRWVSLWSYADTTASFDTPVFEFVDLPLTNPSYFYDGFQFRFRNLASLTGQRDLWHVDYVRLTAGQNISPILNDVAFTAPPTSLLEAYTAMPWPHFEGNESSLVARQNFLGIFNHFSSTQFVGPVTFSLFDESDNIAFATNVLNFATPPLNGNIPVGYNPIDSVLADLEATLLASSFMPYHGSTKRTFELEVRMSPNNQQNTIDAVIRNDTIRRRIVFDDYFAYDDGNAETAVAAGRIGDQFAVAFTANVADTLKAVRLHLPRFEGLGSNQRINLKVWVNDLTTEPVFQENFVRPIFVDSLESWTTYSLDTNYVVLPAGTTFYVGWQQATTPATISRSFLIGYDRNSPKGFSKIYQNVGGFWEKLDTVAVAPEPGSIMLRPVLGGGNYFSSSVVEVEEALFALNLFPNPARETLQVALSRGEHRSFDYHIVNIAGQIMQSGQLSDRLPLDGLPSGWYALQLIDRHTGQSVAKPFVVVD